MSKNNRYRIVVENETSPSHRMKKMTIVEAYNTAKYKHVQHMYLCNIFAKNLIERQYCGDVFLRPSNFRTIYFDLFWPSGSEVTVPWTVNRPQKPRHPLSFRSAMRHWHLNCEVIRKHNPLEKTGKEIHPSLKRTEKESMLDNYFQVWNPWHHWSLLNVNPLILWRFRFPADHIRE